MSFDGRAVANFVLDVCDAENLPITHLSLQKIVFFCHAWSLTKLQRPLVKHAFEAWQFGPVLQYLYRDFKEFESAPINRRATKMDLNSGSRQIVEYAFEVETEELLRKVIRFYGRLSAGTLVELSHVEQGPWDQAWNHSGQVNPGMTIDDDSIAAFYVKARVPF